MLYLLRPLTDWDPWYDKVFGFVVRASSPVEAREMAANECGDEGAAVWLDPENTTCEELLAEGESVVILRDCASA
jgi:hypothetical protein